MATAVKIDDDLRKRVEHLADVRKQSAAGLLREAIQQYVEREEARDSFRQEAVDSWASYQANGRHLTGDDVCDWLATWGTEKETPVPECRD